MNAGREGSSLHLAGDLEPWLGVLLAVAGGEQPADDPVQFAGGGGQTGGGGGLGEAFKIRQIGHRILQ